MNTRIITRLKKLAQASTALGRKERVGWFSEKLLLDMGFSSEDAAFGAFATPRRILWLIEQEENNRT